MRLVVFALIAGLAPAAARADDGRLLGDDSFAITRGGGLWADAGLAVGAPAALPTGMATGLAAGVTRDCSCWWSYGARLAWSTTSEAGAAWTVSQADLRLRATASIRHVVGGAGGRGTIALRLGLGPTLVREVRDRNQGARAGLTGDALQTTALAALPAAELEVVVALQIAGPWAVVVSVGPTVDVHDGGAHGGWIAGLGVGWRP